MVSGCIGFLQGGPLTRRLEIVSAPLVSQPDLFWSGVRDMDIQSFGSDETDIPLLANQLFHRDRCEFLIDLTCSDPFDSMSKNHRRNINRAIKSEIGIQRKRQKSAVEHHLALINASLRRRKDRGEDVSIPNEKLFLEALLENRAAEIFQATNHDNILSSIMILRSENSVYYQSAGTSSAGMKIGASMFLIFEVAKIMKKEGVSMFNLGGAGPDEKGLQRFKQGFGTRKVRLEAATFSMVSPIKRRLREMTRSVFRKPKTFFLSIRKKKGSLS